MELPAKMEHVRHKHGGRIVSIEKMAHSIDPPEDGYSRDTWFFLGTVEWDDDGGKSESLEIHPIMLCHDGEHRKEVDELCEMISHYLVEHGTWNHERDGTPKGWNANR